MFSLETSIQLEAETHRLTEAEREAHTAQEGVTELTARLDEAERSSDLLQAQLAALLRESLSQQPSSATPSVSRNSDSQSHQARREDITTSRGGGGSLSFGGASVLGLMKNRESVDKRAFLHRLKKSLTPLHVACGKGQAGKVEKLLKARADVNATASIEALGVTPLMLAFGG